MLVVTDVKELFWLTMTVILTGVMWIPYVLNRCQIRGLTGAMANPSRNDKPHSEWATRMMFAHDNAVENLIIFAPLVLILSQTRLFDEMDRSRLCGVFLVPRRASDRLHDRPAGVPHASLHHRLPRAGRAGAGDLQDRLTSRVRPVRRAAAMRAASTAPPVHELTGFSGPRQTASRPIHRQNLGLRPSRSPMNSSCPRWRRCRAAIPAMDNCSSD